jgi:hypothetical protein
MHKTHEFRNILNTQFKMTDSAGAVIKEVKVTYVGDMNISTLNRSTGGGHELG